MATTDTLAITYMELGQAQKEATANAAFNALADAIGGREIISTTGGNTTLTDAQARAAVMEITGTLTSNATIIVPSWTKLTVVYNNTSGAFTATVKTASGTGIAVPQRGRMLLYCNATNVVLLFKDPGASAQAAVTLGNTDDAIGGLAIGAAYSQAEVQALRNACETLADDVRALSGLVHAMRDALVVHGIIKGGA